MFAGMRGGFFGAAPKRTATQVAAKAAASSTVTAEAKSELAAAAASPHGAGGLPLFVLPGGGAAELALVSLLEALAQQRPLDGDSSSAGTAADGKAETKTVVEAKHKQQLSLEQRLAAVVRGKDTAIHTVSGTQSGPGPSDQLALRLLAAAVRAVPEQLLTNRCVIMPSVNRRC